MVIVIVNYFFPNVFTLLLGLKEFHFFFKKKKQLNDEKLLLLQQYWFLTKYNKIAGLKPLADDQFFFIIPHIMNGKNGRREDFFT